MSIDTGRRTVDGTVERGYEAVRDAFAANFAERGEVGAACAVYVEGRKVVDLWGGVADHVTGRPWTEHTINVIWSATKGSVGALMHLLAQQGRIDLDRPVADYWPEFARNGKQDVTVRMILSMRAGLPVIEAPVTFDDLLAGMPVVASLEGQAPVWPPGSAHGYHAFTYGFLLGEVVRRVTGRSIGQVFAEEVAAPLGLDFWIGLPAELEPRVARLIDVDPDDRGELARMPEAFRVPGEAFASAFRDPSSLTHRVLRPAGSGWENSAFNEGPAHQAEWAFGGGICDARSLARLYAACVDEVDGVRLLTDATLADATAEQASGRDEVLIYPATWGSGFMLANELESWLGPGSFGFTGAGGHLGLGHAGLRVGVGYTMTRMFGNLTGDPRPRAVLDALATCLDAR